MMLLFRRRKGASRCGSALNLPAAARRSRRAAAFAAAVFAAAAALYSPNKASADNELAEYTVKAAFLYHFINYTRWPPDLFVAKEQPLLLCVLDGSFLEQAFEGVPGKDKHGRRIETRFFGGAAEAETIHRCHVLFASGGREDDLEKLAAKLRYRPVLTIADRAAAAIITFRIVNERVRFAVDLRRLRDAELELSAQVLKLAVDVQN